MKTWMLIILTAASLGLAACQSADLLGVTAGGDIGNQRASVMKDSDIKRNQRVVLAEIADKNKIARPKVYFSADGQYHSTPVPGGYYREILSRAGNGGWVVQDFYQDSGAKQVDPLLLFHPDALRNFGNDVVDGTVVWYRPDGTLSQSATYVRGELEGWLTYYDKQGRGRFSVQYVKNQPSGAQQAFDEQERLVMRVLPFDEQKGRVQEFWHGNGKLAVRWHAKNDKMEGWDEHGQALTDHQAFYLMQYLNKRLYEVAE